MDIDKMTLMGLHNIVWVTYGDGSGAVNSGSSTALKMNDCV